MPLFYALLVLITAGGVALLFSNLNSRTAPTTGKTLVSSIPLESLPSRGSADAPVTVVEYADFQCPACGVFFNSIEPGIVKAYIDTGKVKFVFHDFPLSQHRTPSRPQRLREPPATRTRICRCTTCCSRGKPSGRTCHNRSSSS